MGEALLKLRADGDLQCYFERPSAVAALSEAGETGFVVSGCWRQQFDWAVVEWNRDNTFEHPAFRNLPDGDLSGLSLSYEETRENCIPFDSDLYPTVDWLYLRIWAERLYKVRLWDYATAVEGSYIAASAELELTGAITAGDCVGVAWTGEAYERIAAAGETLEEVVEGLRAAVEAGSATMRAERSGARLRLVLRSAGANGNRIGVYGFVAGARTEAWTPWWAALAGGASPSRWRIDLNFGDLRDIEGAAVPTGDVRKMRWTYAADLQRGEFARSEFAVRVSNWTVSGTGREYRVAGWGSRRIEDDAREVEYSGERQRARGNFSGGSIGWTAQAGAGLTCAYRATAAHELYLGTRRADSGGEVGIAIDGGAVVVRDLRIAGEDVLARVKVAALGAGDHSVAIRNISGTFWFDFLEPAIPAAEAPEIAGDARLAIATDWDTDHSIALAPERTARMAASLGFHGRENHYAGAMWFYELTRAGHEYARGMVTFSGEPGAGFATAVTIGRAGDPGSAVTLTHAHASGDTADTIAKAFELELNRGYMSVRAAADGGVLTVYARAMGVEGNQVTLAAGTTSPTFGAAASGPALAGGVDGEWRTDLGAMPRLNRAARDWTRSFVAALAGRGIAGTAALSMELRHGDPSEAAGIAQRCPAGDPVIVATPAVQTNFSAASLAFWKEAYRELAELMVEAGMQPYLQFGETQWWYFREGRSGMPYYDAETKAAFLARYGREMAAIADENADPEAHAEEAEFLAGRIGEFTDAVMEYVRQYVAGCRFEALYPLDVNESAWNARVNFPAAAWTPGRLACLKTENFGYTYARDLDKARAAIGFPGERGFGAGGTAHLVGVGEATAPWAKELRVAVARGVESVVGFALDQWCLVGCEVGVGMRRSVYLG